MQTGNIKNTQGEKIHAVELKLCLRNFSQLTQLAGEAKVDDFDLCASRVYAHNVLWFEVQVYNVLLVNVLHALQDLPHVTGAGELRVLKVVVYEPLEELPACDAEETRLQCRSRQQQEFIVGVTHYSRTITVSARVS